MVKLILVLLVALIIAGGFMAIDAGTGKGNGISDCSHSIAVGTEPDATFGDFVSGLAECGAGLVK